jgi:uncharacterized protein YutE (UPF0331/DUF86 family)
VVQARLRLIADSLDQLERLAGLSAEELSARPIERAAAERLLQVVVDLAVDVNALLVRSLTGAAPTTGRASFESVGATGVIDRDLAGRLAPAAGLRNVLVHRYTDIDVKRVAAAATSALGDFREYVRQVARFVSDSA